jgi:hypothetical protein
MRAPMLVTSRGCASLQQLSAVKLKLVADRLTWRAASSWLPGRLPCTLSVAVMTSPAAGASVRLRMHCQLSC